MSETTLSSVDRDKLRVLFEEIIPFNRYLGVRAGEIGDGRATLEIPFRPELVGNPLTGALHGGVISALLDACGGIAVWSQIRPEDMVATVDLRVDYLRPARAETLIGAGEVVRLGNRVGVVQLRAFHPSAEDRPVAAGMGVYNIRRSGKVGRDDLWARLMDRAAEQS
jgi:uncharacterized protein (TIGR00369 family)